MGTFDHAKRRGPVGPCILGLLASGLLAGWQPAWCKDPDPPELPKPPTTLPDTTKGDAKDAKAYKATKDFTWTSPGVATLKSAEIETFAHVFAKTTLKNGLKASDSAVDPVAQDRKAGVKPFDPMAADAWNAAKSPPVTNNGEPVKVNAEPFKLGGAANVGPGSSAQGHAHAGPVRAFGAIAESDAWGAAVRGNAAIHAGRNDTVYARLGVWGYARADTAANVLSSEAYAGSYAGLRLNGTLAAGLFGHVTQQNNGLVIGNPVIDSTTAKGVTASAKDPISFTILDADSGDALWQDWLLDTDMSIDFSSAAAPSRLEWTTSGLSIDALDADVAVRLNAAYVTQPGELRLSIRGGVVTQSFDEGVFDGWLPAIGTAGPLLLNRFADGLSFDYDLGALQTRFAADDVLSIEANSVMGRAYAVHAVPEPSTVALLAAGLLALAVRLRRRGAQ